MSLLQYASEVKQARVGEASEKVTGTGAANVRVSRMKNSLPETPCSAGVRPVNVVVHATIVDEGSVERIVSSKWAWAKRGGAGGVALASASRSAWGHGSSPRRRAKPGSFPSRRRR